GRIPRQGAQARTASEIPGAARLPPPAHLAEEAALCGGILCAAVQEEEGQALYQGDQGAAGPARRLQRRGPGARDALASDRRRRYRAARPGRSLFRLGRDQRLALRARDAPGKERDEALGRLQAHRAVLGLTMRVAIDPAKAADYPANIQAILKRQAPCSAWLGQELLEIDTETGFARIAYELGEPHFNRFGALHGGAIACVMDDVLAV